MLPRNGWENPVSGRGLINAVLGLVGLILDEDALVIVADRYAVDGLHPGQRDIRTRGGDQAWRFDRRRGLSDDGAADVEGGHGSSPQVSFDPPRIAPRGSSPSARPAPVKGI